MQLSYTPWAQARRSFFLLFGGIWLLLGSVFLVVGISIGLDERGLLPVARQQPSQVENPTVEARKDNAPWPIFAVIGVFFGGIGGFLFFREIGRIRYRARLCESGETTQGTVTAIEETSVRINKVRQWRLRYRYRDHFGQEHDGKTSYLAPRVAQSWSQGQGGEVRFEREAPGRSLWIG